MFGGLDNSMEISPQIFYLIHEEFNGEIEKYYSFYLQSSKDSGDIIFKII
jgi:hypothetical protein